VLLSGDHAAIEAWRRRQALAATLRKRPDLLRRAALEPRDRRLLEELRGQLGLAGSSGE
jgi:tRNA (guanine37-N1)-methyltransferase